MVNGGQTGFPTMSRSGLRTGRHPSTPKQTKAPGVRHRFGAPDESSKVTQAPNMKPAEP
jgi:hypothetical protein